MADYNDYDVPYDGLVRIATGELPPTQEVVMMMARELIRRRDREATVEREVALYKKGFAR